MPVACTFRLGFAPDVGWLVGIPGVTPLALRGDRFTADVEDPQSALEALRRAGFPDALLVPAPRGP